MVVNGEFCTYVSPSVTAMLGFDPAELVGRPAADVIHDDDKERVVDCIGSSEDATKPVTVQFRMHTKAGGFRPVEAVIADQRDRPSVGGLVATIRDITERTKAAQELQRSQESFRVLFDQHPHPMWVYDPETLRFLEVNQCATETYGYTRGEFLSMRITDIRPAEDARKLVNYLRVERPELDHAGIWRHRTKAGDIIEVEVTAHSVSFRGRRAGLVMAQNVTERIRLEQQLRDHALHDPLTGLPNRALLLDRIERLTTSARRSGAEATVLSLKLDHFKLVNEAYGHDVGDGLLRAVGERLVNAIRDADSVGRIAGDGFVILALLPALHAKPEELAARVLDLISSEPFLVDGHELAMTTSIGIIAGNYGDLIQNADTALDLAKSEGGNRFIVFEQEMQAAVDERVQLTIDLRDAVGAGQIETYYQPVIRLKDLGVVGVEALARWHHPSLGLVPPVRFIPLAEETGIIGDIGGLVLRQACTQAKAWQRQHEKLTVSVNVSVFQLRSEEFIDVVRRVLEQSGLDPESLILEVTESVLITNPETALNRLKALKGLGVRLAIDDFGSGYSSLSYLRLFPFDILKIDQSFIESMVDSPQAMAMVRTMIQLGRELKLEVVAEGVETEQQLEMLRKLRCQDVQGYLFSRPAEADVITSYLTECSADCPGIATAVPHGPLRPRLDGTAPHQGRVAPSPSSIALRR
jgi:diguanylate cyclase (GGDEF)-like protein/PAS domain S-box-containing protein